MARAKAKPKKILTRDAVSRGLAAGVEPDAPGTCTCCSKSAAYGVTGQISEAGVYHLTFCVGCYLKICKSDFGAEVDRYARKQLGLKPRPVPKASDAEIGPKKAKKSKRRSKTGKK